MHDLPRVGSAGWSIPAAHRDVIASGSLLRRYAARFNAVEINTSFYRPHRRATYERWAATVPDGFRFAVKLPKTITHERRLRACDDLVERFAGEVLGRAAKLGGLLVQLPPSFGFDPEVALPFFDGLRHRIDRPVACEPRHASWLRPEAETLLSRAAVARVAADPAPVPGAGESGGWDGLVYLRLHGAPKIYYSAYEDAVLAGAAQRLLAARSRGALAWCVLDNTADGHAFGDALSVADHLVRQA